MQNQIAIKQIKIKRPDDWHLHVRDGEVLKTVLPFTTAHYARAIIMPNLAQPITTLDQAIEYRKKIITAIPNGHTFTPLMTCYLSKNVTPQILEQGFSQKLFVAAKLYPAHATTNSSHGIEDLREAYPLFECMQKIGMPLLIHGEVTDKEIDIFDREAVFIDRTLTKIRADFPELKLVLEHITTKEAAQYILEGDLFIGATITPQHLLLNRNDMLVGGIKPHLYCLPILKRNIHQNALRQAIATGHPRIFLGTDSAPHFKHLKEHACGCAGAFNALNALAIYAEVFEQMNALEYFEQFASINGANFYGLPVNEEIITLEKQDSIQPSVIEVGDNQIVPFMAGETLAWQVIKS
ncbi:dihydroorotase [Thorsellia anophelis]|uniref:Dihydroorotase n=1 Tax=Thorsellia anophelis DSM 18579 TaxID=1123402 RepID=A0A1I0AA42_9GAMM|nr:dihydroorotase [Thorsellia anophelis]SES91020.1 dihydroorotase [Thorsellia anophelis DSM 18579]